jgi:hypothetical protein
MQKGYYSSGRFFLTRSGQKKRLFMTTSPEISSAQHGIPGAVVSIYSPAYPVFFLKLPFLSNTSTALPQHVLPPDRTLQLSHTALPGKRGFSDVNLQGKNSGKKRNFLVFL